jgi:hypothetical protein
MKRSHLTFIVLASLTLSFLGPTANADEQVGGGCKKLGETAVDPSGFKHKCIKSGKKLLWSKGIKNVVKVEPTKTSSTAQSSTPMGAFIVANPVDLQHVVRLSKFRSCVGHDYSPGIIMAKSGAEDSTLENKRSMKHYIIIDVASTPSRTVKGYAPFDGVISYDTVGASMGIGVSVTSPEGWVFEFMHVEPLAANGKKVKAGDVIVAAPADNAAAAGASKNTGTTPTGINETNVFDIALFSISTKPELFESFIDHLAPKVAALWSAKGFTSQTSILSKATRDAAPCITDGSWNGNFVGFAPESDYINAVGYTPTKSSSSSSGQDVAKKTDSGTQQSGSSSSSNGMFSQLGETCDLTKGTSSKSSDGTQLVCMVSSDGRTTWQVKK